MINELQAEDASVTAVAWNCTGSIIAVAYHVLSHSILPMFFFFLLLLLTPLDMVDLITRGGALTLASCARGVFFVEILIPHDPIWSLMQVRRCST